MPLFKKRTLVTVDVYIGSIEPSQYISEMTVAKQTSEAAPIEHQGELIAQAISLFNLKPSKGINFLFDNEVIPNTATAVAHFLYETPDLNKQHIGAYIGDGDAFNAQVLVAFMELFDFTGVEFDVALRRMLQRFILPAEAQQIDRVMEKFAQQYYKQNPNNGVFTSSEPVYILAFSTIMLNTDAHNPNVKRKMTKSEFIAQHAGGNIPTPFIEDLYDRIVNDSIKLPGEETAPSTKKRRWRKGRFKAWRDRWLKKM